jgi:hypothetical protein
MKVHRMTVELEAVLVIVNIGQKQHYQNTAKYNKKNPKRNH